MAECGVERSRMLVGGTIGSRKAQVVAGAPPAPSRFPRLRAAWSVASATVAGGAAGDSQRITVTAGFAREKDPEPTRSAWHRPL